MQRLSFTPLRHNLLKPKIIQSTLFLSLRRYTAPKPSSQPSITPITPQPTIPPHSTIPPPPEPLKETQRFEKVLNKTPRFLRKWLEPISHKPLSHISSFLILHEITAIIPLLSLTYLYHKLQWTPPVLPGEWLVQGAEKGARIIRHYGINVKGDDFVRLAFEFAAAYASVKGLVPRSVEGIEKGEG